jgi:hypothetical protein
MIKYKITTMFQADWDNLFRSVFHDCQHSYSEINGNVAVYGFDTPQTPADLGPLVRIELLSE